MTEERVTVYCTKNQEETEKVLLFLKANGVEALSRKMGEGAYRDIYGGNNAYGQEISIRKEDEEKAKVILTAYLKNVEKKPWQQGVGGKLLLGAAGAFVVLAILARYL